MCHTCVGDGGVFVQGHQRRVQQHHVRVFGDHPVVRCLNPRLVFIHCGHRKHKSVRRRWNSSATRYGGTRQNKHGEIHVFNFVPPSEAVRGWTIQLWNAHAGKRGARRREYTAHFNLLLAKHLQPRFLQVILIMLISPAVSFLSGFLYFLLFKHSLQVFKAHYAWSMTTTVLPAQNCVQGQVKTKFMSRGPD